eukprot:30991-Pelagococcus_subviridis.AAC.17
MGAEKRPPGKKVLKERRAQRERGRMGTSARNQDAPRARRGRDERRRDLRAVAVDPQRAHARAAREPVHIAAGIRGGIRIVAAGAAADPSPPGRPVRLRRPALTLPHLQSPLLRRGGEKIPARVERDDVTLSWGGVERRQVELKGNAGGD